ncbi:hypothetical protein L3049_04315 [Labilibaculum sp. DW002]|uniref:Polysaccharide biosynthesis protein C-terminal domain-containing protein n=1 Tax=Paralabilibaculum antarcticum TaxID=2912572 RepID=A0ABT5VPQ0_9BACT|nr:oligosaccharide flippase family protein [Labilibaculum sp. DW002]MDE5417225.1 hypothetical protein [Labilibaculum sp. DW002]
MKFSIKKIKNNSVVVYLATRYLTYFAQFVISIFIAVKLGPYYFGLWGFLLLLLSYFQITNFGISNAINILLVQHKKDEFKIRDLISNAFALISCLCFIVLLLALYYYYYGIYFFEKYEVGNLFYPICLIAMFVYVNMLLMTIYRVRNKLFEIAFYQSIIPFLVLIALITVDDKNLIVILLGIYLLGHTLSFLMFIFRKVLPVKGNVNLKDSKIIINKGFFLFVYNICFYLLIISVRTIVSIYYPVKEFGYFTFSYTLANSILLLLEAMTFVVFPKLIDKLNSDDPDVVEKNIEKIRTNYVYLSHGLIYIALVFFPIFVQLLPKYVDTLPALNLIALTIVLYTNAFGYNSYLMARNKEKIIALVSFVALFINVLLALILVVVFQIVYSHVIIATMFAYLFCILLFVYFGKKNLGRKISFLSIFQEAFPIKLLIPYLVAVVISLMEIRLAVFVPLILFIILNVSVIKKILNTIKNVIYKPEVINI